MWNRPLKLSKGWSKETLDELITAVENYLYDFAKTKAFDSGVRLAEVEAYLQGLLDAKRVKNNKEYVKQYSTYNLSPVF